MAAHIFPVQMMTRLAHTGPIEMDPGFNASAVTTGLTDIAASVAQQARAPCDVMLMFRYAKDITEYDYLGEYWTEVQKYPNIKWVYMYDELFWTTKGIVIGKDAGPVVWAARLVQSVRLKSAVSFLPEVIINPAFAIELGVFDVIGIDVYPSLGSGGWMTADLALDPNRYFYFLQAAVVKLRAMGFKGEIWYIYQAFGNSDDPNLIVNLTAQRYTLGRAPELGISGAVSFGYYDDTGTNLPPPLYPGHGSAFDALVMP